MFFIGLSNVVSQNKKSNLEEYTGKYDGNRIVAIENGKLFIQRNGGRKIVLEQRTGDTFESTSGMFPPLKFKKNSKGEVIGFVMLRGTKEGELRKKISDSAKAVKEKIITAQEKKELINGLGKTLLDNYVFPEVAEKYNSFLQNNLKSGKYNSINGEVTFARTITKDLKTFHEDKHLFVLTNEAYKERQKRMERAMADMRAVKKGKGKSENTFMHSKILDGNIGYVTITSFPGSKEAQDHAHNVMQSVKDCKAIVFDLNSNRGGGRPVIDVIESYLYKKPTHTLNAFSPKENNGKVRKRFTKPNKFSKKMSKIPVYVLQSNKTGSAGEAFTMSFKSTGRGIVVGENTYGAGHYSEFMPVSKKFHALIPIGRSFNPKTGEGWEGVGVTPDVKKDPKKALNWVLNKIK